MTDPLASSLPRLAAALADRRLSAHDLVEAAIARHDRFGDALNAYSLWTPAAARATAAAADAAFAVGAIAGPLQGLPVSVKDLFAVAGMPTFAGSPRRLPPEWEIDGPVIAALRRQLGVIMGKTQMVEFAFGGSGYNAHHGMPRNPWDAAVERSPGGSSSGAGVSLAEGSALLALGSDTAGSVRMPAAMTGQVGLKLTLGRWSAEGVVPLCPSFDTPGILARSVADIAYGFAALDPRWGEWAPFERQHGGTEIAGVRIACGEPSLWEDCDPGIAETARAALAELAKAGARLSDATLPEAAAAIAVHREGRISAIELRSFLMRELPDWLKTLDPTVAPRVRTAEGVLAEDYLARLAEVRRLASAARARFAAIEVIASPTVPTTPPSAADIRDAARFARVNGYLTRNTVVANYLGLCAVTLPVGLDHAGMPVGLQLMAPGGGEERLLAIALAAERVLGDGPVRLGVPPLLRAER